MDGCLLWSLAAMTLFPQKNDQGDHTIHLNGLDPRRLVVPRLRNSNPSLGALTSPVRRVTRPSTAETPGVFEWIGFCSSGRIQARPTWSSRPCLCPGGARQAEPWELRTHRGHSPVAESRQKDGNAFIDQPYLTDRSTAV